ncbi:MAG: hypothetical protein M3Y30_12930 [Gemmatimonadota bacterium]|nr:hypothetical protein [Gemmatimonadota bacterium]
MPRPVGEEQRHHEFVLLLQSRKPRSVIGIGSSLTRVGAKSRKHALGAKTPEVGARDGDNEIRGLPGLGLIEAQVIERSARLGLSHVEEAPDLEVVRARRADRDVEARGEHGLGNRLGQE